MNNSTDSNLTLGSMARHCRKKEQDSSAVITVKTVILCTIMLSALVGNMGIIAIVFKTKTLRRAVNFFIVNMAVADCLLAIFAIPHFIVPIVTQSSDWKVHGHAGLVLCKIVFVIIDTAYVASILSMVCLACDRFCAVAKPMNRSLITSATRKGAIILTWVVAIGYSFPYFYTVKMTSHNGSSYCQVDWGSANIDHVQAITIHTTVSFSVFGILPWVLVIILYAIMIVEIKRSKQESQPNLHCCGSRKSDIDLKVIKLSFAIVISFAVCNFPLSTLYFVVAIVWRWSVICPPSFWSNLWFSSQALVFLYTVLNPCVCFIFSENFRKGFKSLLRCRRRHSFMDGLSLTSRHRQSKTTYVDSNLNPSYAELSAENSISIRMEFIEKRNSLED